MSIIQTFYVSPSAVNGAEFIALTNVDLYFEARPNNRSNSSGIRNPGVTVSLCEVVNDTPRPDTRRRQRGRLSYEEVTPSSDAMTPTTVAFDSPIVVETGRHYGIIVDFDDPGYSLWKHVSGDRTVGTNVPSASVTDNRNGKFYQFTGNTPTIAVDTALKFAIRMAKFDDQNPYTIVLSNHGYEFLQFENNVGALVGGERVYVDTANIAGTLDISADNTLVAGSGTTFTSLTEDSFLVLKSGANVFVRQIEYINSDTEIELFEPVPITNAAAKAAIGIIGTVQRIDYDAKKLILNKSSATAANKFAIGQTVVGEQSGALAEITSLDDYEIDRIRATLDISVAGDNTFSTKYKTVKKDGGTYVDDNIENPLPNLTDVVTDERSVLASHSIEVANTSVFDDGSLGISVSAATTNPFAAPLIDLNNSTVILTSEVIDNTYLDSNGDDSEIFNGGVAINKHFTTKLSLSEGRVAEDLKVFLTGYRPRSTNLRVYAKFRAGGDQEPFDDKLWTPLTETGEYAGTFSSSIDRTDLVELEFSVPTTPETSEVLVGSFTTADDSPVISSSAGYDPSVDLVAGDTIKVYNELFPTNYVVTTVESVNSTSVTISENITLAGITGTGQKIAKLKYARTAFTYEANDNVLRYLDETGGVHDGFVEAQLKILFLGDPEVRISPRIDQLEMIGVSS